MDNNTNITSTRTDSASDQIAYTITTISAHVSPDKLSGFFQMFNSQHESNNPTVPLLFVTN
jgi:hypothetical protein